VTFVTALRRHRLRSCGLTEAPGTLPLTTAERSVTERRVRQVQRAAFLHSVQVDHGIEKVREERVNVGVGYEVLTAINGGSELLIFVPPTAPVRSS